MPTDVLTRRYSVLLHPLVQVPNAISQLSAFRLRPEGKLTSELPILTHSSSFHKYVGNTTALWLALERWRKLYALRNADWFRINSYALTQGASDTCRTSLLEIDRNLEDLCYSFQAVPSDEHPPTPKNRYCHAVPTTDIILFCPREGTSDLVKLLSKRNCFKSCIPEMDRRSRSLCHDSLLSGITPMRTWVISMGGSGGTEIAQIRLHNEGASHELLTQHWLTFSTPDAGGEIPHKSEKEV
mmetsp:Transcript_13926/g.21679  ORF Transcript_13926/g.21679 Transcript_13926/m.21679 type:complete len:241 (-) Transcript_13926:79-801(-)